MGGGEARGRVQRRRATASPTSRQAEQLADEVLLGAADLARARTTAG